MLSGARLEGLGKVAGTVGEEGLEEWGGKVVVEGSGKVREDGLDEWSVWKGVVEGAGRVGRKAWKNGVSGKGW